MAGRHWNLRAIWRDGDREDPFLVRTTQTNPQGCRDPLALMSQFSLPATESRNRGGKRGKYGADRAEGDGCEKARETQWILLFL